MSRGRVGAQKIGVVRNIIHALLQNKIRHVTAEHWFTINTVVAKIKRVLLVRSCTVLYHAGLKHFSFQTESLITTRTTSSYVHVMAYVVGCRLRVEVEVKSSGEWLWAEYDNMTIESETNKYRLHVTGYHGNAGDAFNGGYYAGWHANGMAFSTVDVDNDQWPDGSCGGGSGWWFKRCSSSNMNGKRVGAWYTAKPAISVSTSRMMLQCGVQ